MKIYEEIVTEVESGFICDKCRNHTFKNDIDYQEALHIDTFGGYTIVYSVIVIK